MKFQALVAFFAVAAARSTLFNPDLDEMWENFKKIFGKSYNGREEVARRLIWEQRVADIARHNLEFDMGLHLYSEGINKYSDMEHEEFVKAFNGASLQLDKPSNGSHWVPLSYVELPNEVDWRVEGLVTGVKDQQQCGSCWAFSATGSLEGQHKKKTGQLISLSEQNLMDCSTSEGNMGCRGGWASRSFDYIRKNHGIDTEGSYPYTALEGSCRFNPHSIGARVTGYVNTPSGNENALKEAVASIGPISVKIDANHKSFQSYRGGIYYEPACSTDKLDHAVLIVGYGNENGVDYWLVKNSWGTSWGIQGYIKMVRNKNNNCGIATVAIYPLV